MQIGMRVLGDKEVALMLSNVPKQASRAAEMALDYTAKAGRDAIKQEMPRVFDRPTPFTLNSLKVTPTRNHNMQASIWFKEPDRMSEHYLVPQVEGGKRNLKGFERALGNKEFVPAIGAKRNQYGNVSPGQIRQLLSVLGRAERFSGYSANITSRSRRANRKERDYVLITKRRGRLIPGVYQRFQTGAGFGAKTKRTFADQSRSYQKGRTRGRFSSVVRARGLRPVLLIGRTGHRVSPLLDFYGIATRIFEKTFANVFWQRFNSLVRS